MIDYSPKRPLLFLDIDGVLNGHEQFNAQVGSSVIQAQAVNLLNLVLKHTDSQFVLSSAWRYLVHRNEMSLSGLSWLLRSHGIYDRLVGVTRMDTMVTPERPVPDERGVQITEWLKTHQHCGLYAVVDDLDLGISDSGHPFVQTDGKVGLTVKQGAKLIGLLSAPGELPG